MSAARIVKFTILIQYKSKFYLKVPLSCSYKDIIKNKINGVLSLYLRQSKPAFHKLLAYDTATCVESNKAAIFIIIYVIWDLGF